MMETSSNNEYHPITIIKNSLPPQSQKSSSIKLAIRKDKRLEYLNIPKGLIELLHINDFTIEKILEYGPSKIAEILAIDDYVARIIFSETNNKKY